MATASVARAVVRWRLMKTVALRFALEVGEASSVPPERPAPSGSSFGPALPICVVRWSANR